MSSGESRLAPPSPLVVLADVLGLVRDPNPIGLGLLFVATSFPVR